jgi:hypothetical protein
MRKELDDLLNMDSKPSKAPSKWSKNTELSVKNKIPSLGMTQQDFEEFDRILESNTKSQLTFSKFKRA